MTRIVYTCLLFLLLPLTPLKLLWRSRLQPEYLQHWRERYGFYSFKNQRPVIWLHCVSVGETRAASPLVQALCHHYPKHQILLTHSTPTGRTTSELLFGDKVLRAYLPYDLPFAVNRFLKHFNPTIGVLVETELWFNLISACKQREIPLLLVNARLSQKSARGYAKLGNVAKVGLQSLTAIAAQTDQDAERFTGLVAGKSDNLISVIGNLKFDVMPPDDALSLGHRLRNQLGQNRPVLLAASTRDGEEAILLSAIHAAKIPHLLTVIVPRHPQRFDEVASLLRKNGLPFIRRSTLSTASLEAVSPKVNFILGDSMGEMFNYYAACDVAFIGGSLLPLGGQNLIEASSLGKPVLIGPYTFNFEQASELAISAGAAKRVQDEEDLTDVLQTIFADQSLQQQMSEAALRFSEHSRGATLRTMVLIAAYIKA